MKSQSSVFEWLDAYAAARMDADRTPGLAVAITDRDQLLHVATYGFADVAARATVTPETLFETGSIGKSFTSIALLQLREEGLIDLHAPVTTYLPWFEIASDFAPFTLHHLMSHTAGIVSGTDFAPEATFQVWSLRDTQTGSPPGAFFHYSNVGYKVLGLVLEAVTGQPYGEIIQQRILDPLGLAATTPVITHATRPHLAVGYQFLYDDRPPRRSHPLVPATWLETNTADGCLASNAADMATYLRMLLNRGRGPNGDVLSREGFDLLTQRIELRPGESEERWYGYGMTTSHVDGHTYVGHNGGMVGYFASMIGDLDDGLGVITLVNGPGAPANIAHTTLNALRAAASGKPLPALPSNPDPTLVENAGDYAGVFTTGERSIRLVAEDGKLILEHEGGRTALEREDDDVFLVDDPSLEIFPLWFVRGDDDSVVEALHGADSYRREGLPTPDPVDYPSVWDACPGYYRSHNPWSTNFRIVLRRSELRLIFPEAPDGLEYDQRLVPQEDGSFRVGEDERLAERLRFDTVIDGHARRATLDSAEYYRVDPFTSP